MEHLLNKLPGGTGEMRADLGVKTVTCADHGDYASYGVRYMGKREIWTRCPDCDEAARAAELRRQAEAEAIRRQKVLEDMLHSAAIPARFAGRTFDTFQAATPEQAKALAVVKAFADDFESHRKRGSSLILLGKPGTGKSHLATAALQALMPMYCGLYVTCMQIIRAVRNTWRRDSERSEADVLRQFGEVPLLVIDEIGVQYGTDGEQTILFEVLDRRYREMMPTILLANQSLEGLKTYLGERTYDRLTETGRIVVFDWPSHRPQARKEAA